MMHCKKCEVRNGAGVLETQGGRVFIDQVFSENNHVELFCIRCGKRWMVSKDKGAFAEWLTSRVSGIL